MVQNKLITKHVIVIHGTSMHKCFQNDRCDIKNLNQNQMMLNWGCKTGMLIIKTWI